MLPFDPDPLESRLRQALRPQSPSRDLALLVLRRARQVPAAPRRRPLWSWVALAACLAVAITAGWLVQQRVTERNYQRQASAARQIVRALRLTANDLNRIQQRLPHSAPPGERM
ncbi:MAG: hypothetical protein ACRD01_14515 [Terriglobales bacterium]